MDILNLENITKHLKNGARSKKIIFLKETGSTNTDLIKLLKENKVDNKTVVIADMQTLGRGRLGKSFFSPPGKGIYLSYLLKPENEALYNTVWTAITCCSAVAVANAVKKISSAAPDIKWVNDLYMNGKKICGILTQAELFPTGNRINGIVVGIGVNVNGKAEDFPEELRAVASTLEIESGKEYDRAKLAAYIIEEMDILCESFPSCQSAYLESYKKSCIVIGKNISVIKQSGARAAKALDITDNFSLRVKYENDELEDLSGGEISIKF